MKFDNLILTFLAGVLRNLAERLEDAATIQQAADSIFAKATAIAGAENIDDIPEMNSATLASLNKIRAADSLLARLAILLPALHTTITGLRASVKGAADDKAKLDAQTIELAAVNADLKQFTDLSDHIGTVTDAVGTSTDTDEGDVDAPPTGDGTGNPGGDGTGTGSPPPVGGDTGTGTGGSPTGDGTAPPAGDATGTGDASGAGADAGNAGSGPSTGSDAPGTATPGGTASDSGNGAG